MAEKKQTGTVLVTGAGISGIKASLELADIGYKVLLTDSSPQIGGILAKLDHQFPTDHCGMCRILPMIGREYASQYCMRKGLFHENIEILPFTKLVKVEGDAGNYKIQLQKKARYIDTDKCNGLGKCIKVCPIEKHDEFNHGLTKRKAVYQPVPYSTPEMLLIDMDICTKCDECVKICPTNAINLNAEHEILEKEVHAIILASGVKLYNTKEFEDVKSYAVSKDVVSSLAFERIISGTGTYDNTNYNNKGIIKRPSDNKPAEKIAWIQCMGSRNKRQKRDYCSSICCMFALKEAVLAKEKAGKNVETTIFYMDMRTFGKDFYRYKEKAVNEHNVKLIRCRVQGVMLNPDKSLLIRYFDPKTNEFFTETYDMVVLSTGQIFKQDYEQIAKLFNFKLTSQGLIPTKEYNKIELNKPGVFICGSLMGLTDISEAVSSGIAAAGKASSLLSTLDVAVIEQKVISEPKTVERDLPLISVVLCKCSEKESKTNIDFNMLKKKLQTLNQVGEVNIIDTACNDNGKQELINLLEKSKCNRLLMGLCQPFIYRKSLKNLAKKAGFISSLIEIFDLASLIYKSVQTDETMPDINWTKQALNEIKARIENLKFKPALYVEPLEINQTVLVVGGGIAGMYSALALANKNINVHLIEKSDKLGGYAGNHIENTIEGLKPVSMGKDLQIKVFEHKNIIIHLNCEVTETKGSLGNFKSRITDNIKEKSTYLNHGAAILATGALKSETQEYEYKNSDKILTQNELKQGLETKEINIENAENIVMIQCVGSREISSGEIGKEKEKQGYCSRICCIGAIENALKIKEKNPDIRIFILYRDIMTYGFFEQYYTKARAQGIIFVNYTLNNKPEVEIIDDKPVVAFKEHVLNSQVKISCDFLILSTGIASETSNKQLGKIFNVPINEDGFFVEADSKWRPIEFQKTGFFLAGTAHSPMFLKDAILQAEAASQKAHACLCNETIYTAGTISKVHHSLCVQCQRCVDICPYKARTYDESLNKIIVDNAACQACGMCAVVCQNNASEIMGFSDKQIMAMIDMAL